MAEDRPYVDGNAREFGPEGRPDDVRGRPAGHFVLLCGYDKETREVLVSKAQEGRERVRRQARKAREQAGDWVDRGRDVVGQQKEQFRAAYEAGRQAYRETTATGTEPPSGV